MSDVIIWTLIGILGTPLFIYGILLRFIKIGLFMKFACKIGWHSHNYNSIRKATDDPHQFLTFATCQWCRFEGQVDSQGNLF